MSKSFTSLKEVTAITSIQEGELLQTAIINSLSDYYTVKLAEGEALDLDSIDLDALEKSTNGNDERLIMVLEDIFDEQQTGEGVDDELFDVFDDALFKVREYASNLRLKPEFLVEKGNSEHDYDSIFDFIRRVKAKDDVYNLDDLEADFVENFEITPSMLDLNNPKVLVAHDGISKRDLDRLTSGELEIIYQLGVATFDYKGTEGSMICIVNNFTTEKGDELPNYTISLNLKGRKIGGNSGYRTTIDFANFKHYSKKAEEAIVKTILAATDSLKNKTTAESASEIKSF